MKFKDNWMLALFVIPVITILVLGLAYFGIYPILSQNGLNGIMSIKVIAGVCALLIPGIVSLIFNTNSFLSVAAWIVLTGVALYLEKGGYDGNQHSALAAYFLGFQMLATALSTILITYKLKSKK